MRVRAAWNYGMVVVPIVAVCPAAAQTWTVTARMAIVEYRIAAGFGTERFSGWGLGLAGARRIGPRLSVHVSGQGASLRASASGDLDRRVGELEAGAQLDVGSWGGLYSGLTLRAVASDAARQRWLFGRIGTEVHPAFTGGNLRAIGRLGVIPVAAVSGLSASSFAFDGAVGLAYEHDGVTFGLLYGLERFGFPSQNGIRRSEEMSTFTLRGGIRLP